MEVSFTFKMEVDCVTTLKMQEVHASYAVYSRLQETEQTEGMS